MKLVLFSGGVESTAMLNLVSDKDIVTTLRDNSSDIPNSYNQDAVENICGELGIKVHYTDLSIPIRHERPNLYQFLTFVHVAGLWVTRFPKITEVLHGLNADEPRGYFKEIFDRYINIWNSFYPNTKFVFPFKDMKKIDIWNLIPERIKPLVISCNQPIPCNHCNKCVELKDLRRN